MVLKTEMYFLSPVEVVKVTSSNLEEVAAWCGGHVGTTESKRVPGRMDSYVWVPTPNGSAISWAFPGMFITKRLVNTVKGEQKITYAVFRRDYFDKNYFDTPAAAVAKTWDAPRKATAVVDNSPHLTQPVGQAVQKKGPKPPKKAKKQHEYQGAHDRQAGVVEQLVEGGEEVAEPVTMDKVVQVLENAGIHATEIQPTPEEDPITVEDVALQVIAQSEVDIDIVVDESQQ